MIGFLSANHSACHQHHYSSRCCLQLFEPKTRFGREIITAEQKGDVEQEVRHSCSCVGVSSARRVTNPSRPHFLQKLPVLRQLHKLSQQDIIQMAKKRVLIVYRTVYPACRDRKCGPRMTSRTADGSACSCLRLKQVWARDHHNGWEGKRKTRGPSCLFVRRRLSSATCHHPLRAALPHESCRSCDSSINCHSRTCHRWPRK